MTGSLRAVLASAAIVAIAAAAPAMAQKPGGILKIQHWDSPASLSIHEEATYSVVVPMMGVIQGTAKERLRGNPRKEWYNNVAEVTTNGDYEAVFHLKRPQPALLTLLASGYSPIYPCHVSPAQMRQHPIGTGPFKFVEFKPNQSIKLVKNPDYWKKGLPYLDGIDFTIMREIAPGNLAFFAGEHDAVTPY